LELYAPVCVGCGLPLSAVLNECQARAGHMAFVARDPLRLQAALDSFALFLATANAASAAEAARAAGADAFGVASPGGGPWARSWQGTAVAAAAAKAAAFAEAEKAVVAEAMACGVAGLVTLEDVIEVLLTEEVHDEGDRRRQMQVHDAGSGDIKSDRVKSCVEARAG